MGSLRKYLFNGAIISAIIGGVSALRQQRKGDTDWRTALTWLAWGLTLVVAIGSVRIDSLHEDEPDDVKKAIKKREHKGRGPKPVKDPR